MIIMKNKNIYSHTDTQKSMVTVFFFTLLRFYLWLIDFVFLQKYENEINQSRILRAFVW